MRVQRSADPAQPARDSDALYDRGQRFLTRCIVQLAHRQCHRHDDRRDVRDRRAVEVVEVQRMGLHAVDERGCRAGHLVAVEPDGGFLASAPVLGHELQPLVRSGPGVSSSSSTARATSGASSAGTIPCLMSIVVQATVIQSSQPTA